MQANAAACCLSTSAFGAGRLAVWEEAALGLQLGYSSSRGAFDSRGSYAAHRGYGEEEARAVAFGILRLSSSLEAGIRAPWVVGGRSAQGLSESGDGPGDIAFSLRWEAVPLGAWAELPGIAIVAGASLPTGRAASGSETILGADITGRGDAVLTAGISLERAKDPVFLRLDAAVLLPLARDVAGRSLRAGPGFEILLGGGVDLGAEIIVSLVPRLRWESDGSRDGIALPGSSSLELSLGPAAAWKFDPHWTLQASIDTGLPVDGLGKNRPLPTSATVGIRHGIF